MADRKLLFEQLADAQLLVTQDEERIRAQKQVVAQRERDGKDSADAKKDLARLLDSLARNVETRNAIREQLSFR
jgi:hypothetical protein